MRIIAGEFGGRTLKTLEGDRTRPTSGKVRGAMFSILGPSIAGARVLDLYAGSGAIALEALSRGAKEAVMVENNPAAQRVIADNIATLGAKDRARLVRADVFRTLESLDEPFDVVIADPPYRTVDWSAFLEAVQRAGVPEVVLVEYATGESVPERMGDLIRRREYSYGETGLTVYRRVETNE